MHKAHQKDGMHFRTGNSRPCRSMAMAALAVTGLLAAGCGRSGSQAPASDQSPSQNLVAAMGSFAACIRTHGVPGLYFSRQTTSPNPPPPSGAEYSVYGYTFEFDSSSAFAAAEKACQQLAPFRLSPPLVTRQQFLKALRSAQCIRLHGYPDWPDPKATGHGFLVPAGLDTNSPQFQAAAKTCGLPPDV